MRIPVLVALLCATGAAQSSPPAAIEQDGLKQLLTIRRVYVDRLTGGDTAAQMRDILISALEATKLFVITENQERADVVLRGAAEDLIFTESHASSDGITARINASSKTSSTRSATGGLSIGDNESDRSTERRHEAIAAVRLVNKDGDVVWATTQESVGAKFRGASADVAEKITTKLRDDFERARKLK
jgi:hypothetical protein